MALQQQLRDPGIHVPEHHPSILTPRHDVTHAHDMIRLGRGSNAQHEIPMSLKRPQALPTQCRTTRSRSQLPHLNRLIQRPRHQLPSMRRESDRINTIFMSLLAFRAHDNAAGTHIPDAHALVQTSRRNEVAIWRYCYSSNTVFDLKSERALVLRNVPDADGAVAGAGGDDAAVAGPVEGVDVLVVAGELVADDAGGDVPYLKKNRVSGTMALSRFVWTHPNNLVLSSSSQVFPIRTETDTPNIQIPILVRVGILQLTDLMTSIDIKNLRTAIATRGHISRIPAETNTAHNTRMRKGVKNLNANRSIDKGVVYDMPVLGDAFEMRWEFLGIEIGELVTDAFELGVAVLEVGGDLGVSIHWRCRSGNAWRS